MFAEHTEEQQSINRHDLAEAEGSDSDMWEPDSVKPNRQHFTQPWGALHTVLALCNVFSALQSLLRTDLTL